MSVWNNTNLKRELTVLSAALHQSAERRGFWEDGVTDDVIIRKLMSAVSELGEAYEGLRKRGLNACDEHCPARTNFEVELADTMIWLLDLCGALRIDIGSVLADKATFNETRGNKHGKRF